MEPDFEKGSGLLPAIVQDAHTRKVLMLGYMNREAWKKTRSEGKVCFYSRSKQCLWTKGETSGNYLYLKEMRLDCDADTLLVLAEPAGPVCHTGADTCFDEKNTTGLDFLMYLENLIRERREKMPENSYTTRLFREGTPKIAQKVGEEAVELVIEAMRAERRNDLLRGEAADLFYHLLVLLADTGESLTGVIAELERRHGEKTAGK
ncbi:MAG TPA: bifunctional phosphoribosyl-AMP cyclohydrolase/phosphoribosyl-ATP diphosphatase HisIE [Bacteroidetes bacterium]|nr:bifunctional phosphoribosyl-AMP cyclohydrolase/phosphoribosyl-ATP diphosphatase HisIE [Bacteroidota bacterium]